MKYRSILASLMFVLSLAGAVLCQESHIRTLYAPDIDLVTVEADELYVVNMPTQFMSIRLTASYRKQGQPTQPTSTINFRFTSFAPKHLYEPEQAHQLRVKVDDQVVDFGLLSYSKSVGIDGKNLDMRGALPSVALLKSTSKNDGLALEIMSLPDVTLADISRLAKAGSVVMRVGDTVFPLTATQISILREFVAAITPSNAGSLAAPATPKRVEPEVPADVPSDTNRASLEQTLKWIKTELERESSTEALGFPVKLGVLDFKDCHVRFVVVPGRREVPGSKTLVYAIKEYRMDLGELNPERVTTAKGRDFATLMLSTRGQSKIKVITHTNENGTMGSTVEEGEGTGLILNLKSIEAAARLKVGLIHAINLCHAQH
jgi:hypothetical protein